MHGTRPKVCQALMAGNDCDGGVISPAQATVVAWRGAGVGNGTWQCCAYQFCQCGHRDGDEKSLTYGRMMARTVGWPDPSGGWRGDPPSIHTGAGGRRRPRHCHGHAEKRGCVGLLGWPRAVRVHTGWRTGGEREAWRVPGVGKPCRGRAGCRLRRWPPRRHAVRCEPPGTPPLICGDARHVATVRA